MLAKGSVSFSLPRHIQNTIGQHETTGVRFNLGVGKFSLFSFPLWDFTHSSHLHSRLNTALAKLQIHAKHQFAYMNVDTNRIYEQQWRGWFINEYTGGAGDDVSLSQLLGRAGRYLFSSPSGVQEEDIQALDARATSFEKHQKSWAFIQEHVMSSPLYPNYKCEFLLKSIDKDNPYVLSSTDFLLGITRPALDDIEQYLKAEQASLWWRRWLANNEHISAYEKYLSNWMSEVKAEQHKLAESCFARIQAALLTNDFERDDLVYDFLSITQSGDIHHQELSNYPIRQGMSYQMLAKMSELIERWGNDALKEKYHALKQENVRVFFELELFSFDNQMPSTLVSHQPSFRWWPNWLFSYHNARYDFFDRKNAKRQSLFQSLMKLPWITQGLKNDIPVDSRIMHGFEVLEALSAAKVDGPQQYTGFWGWFRRTYNRFVEAWHFYLEGKTKQAVHAIVEQVRHIKRRSNDEVVIDSENFTLVSDYLNKLDVLTAQYRHYIDIDAMDVITQFKAYAKERLTELERVPSVLHEKADTWLKVLVSGEPIKAGALKELIEIYQSAPFSARDFPNDIYVKNTHLHKQHFHSYTKGLLDVLLKYASAMTKQSHQAQLACLDTMRQVILLLLRFDNPLIHSVLIKTMIDSTIRQLRYGLDCTPALSLLEQRTMLNKFQTIASLSPIFADLKDSLDTLSKTLEQKLNAIERREAVEIELIVLGVVRSKHDLLTEIQSARNYVDACDDDPVKIADYIPKIDLFSQGDSAYNAIQLYAERKNTMLTYLADQLRYVKEAGSTQEKLESVRTELNSVFNFFKANHQCGEVENTVTLFSKPYNTVN